MKERKRARARVVPGLRATISMLERLKIVYESPIVPQNQFGNGEIHKLARFFKEAERLKLVYDYPFEPRFKGALAFFSWISKAFWA